MIPIYIGDLSNVNGWDLIFYCCDLDTDEMKTLFIKSQFFPLLLFIKILFILLITVDNTVYEILFIRMDDVNCWIQIQLLISGYS